MSNNCTINVEALKADGWEVYENCEHQDVHFPVLAEKKIENRNPINTGVDTNISLVIHRLFNTNTFAVLLPDGGMLNFVANSMQELHNFERAIAFYDPVY